MASVENEVATNDGESDVLSKCVTANSTNLPVPLENQYFFEDLVYQITDKRVNFGMVVDNYEDNDSDSDQEEMNYPKLCKGIVRVSWYPLGIEIIVKERVIGLADRSLMPGDVVRRLNPATIEQAQHGYCREITVIADVQQVKTKNVLSSIPNSRLIRLDRYELDLVACLGSWVGSVKEHHTLLNIALLSGNPRLPMSSIIARFELTHVDDCCLRPTEKRRSSNGGCEHFIGQILTAKPSDLVGARWLHVLAADTPIFINALKKRQYLIIENVKTIGVGVRWHCQGLADNTSDIMPTQPDYFVKGELLKNLKMLNVFETCTSQIGDRHYLKVEEGDVVESKSKWLRKQWKLFKHKMSESKRAGVPEDEDITEITTENHNGENGVIDDGEWSTEDSDSSSDTYTGSSGRVTPILTQHNISGKRTPVLATKVLKKKMRKERKLWPKSKPIITADTEPPKPGHPILVETLCTTSIATVVWQDGTIETNIPSTQLYPIHHLDDQEFFPGDFVIKSNPLVAEDLRDYGVVQYMNHGARTAVVKWFRTYAATTTNTEECSPSTHGESEVSVYDLKDHPDFEFRPGTVVVHVAGSSNTSSAAGQVLDNFPEGRISVKWVDGSQSMTWPQDLYRVGDYDSDEGELWDDDDDEEDEPINSEVTHDASWEWETQSEDEVICLRDTPLRSKLAANIERSCEAMSRLEDMFTANPALQGRDVMRKLLEVYKDCRYLDRLMGTSIFHEQHFTALLERAKTRDARSSVSQRIHRHFQRLFSSEDLDTSLTSPEAEKPLEPFDNDQDSVRKTESGVNESESDQVINENMQNLKSDSSNIPIARTAEILSNIVNVQDTVRSKQMNGDESAMKMTESLSSQTIVEPNSPTDSNNQNACKTLCSLIKSRLVIAHAEVLKRLGTADFIHTLRNEADDELPIVETPLTPAGNSTSMASIKSNIANTPEGSIPIELDKEEGFIVLEHAPTSHKFHLSIVQPPESQPWIRAVRKEFKLLERALPRGIWVRGYEDRLDILSVMIRGPADTPYEDGLFLFDVQLCANYPLSPPLFHYVSYCSDRLNPNLYEDGKVCVSLLGTWTGRSSEVWGRDSTLLQVIVSIQGLILNAEPYFNEAGYEKQKGSALGTENSRIYNEMATLKLVQAMTKLIYAPPEVFKKEIYEHFKCRGLGLLSRLEKLLGANEVHSMGASVATNNNEVKEFYEGPAFPLLPASKGFCLSLQSALPRFKESLFKFVLEKTS